MLHIDNNQEIRMCKRDCTGSSRIGLPRMVLRDAAVEGKGEPRVPRHLDLEQYSENFASRISSLDALHESLRELTPIDYQSPQRATRPRVMAAYESPRGVNLDDNVDLMVNLACTPLNESTSSLERIELDRMASQFDRSFSSIFSMDAFK